MNYLKKMQYTELLLNLPNKNKCEKHSYDLFCDYKNTQNYHSNLHSQLIYSKIINCNKYVQQAYDLCCDYCNTQNYYSIYLVSSVVK